MNAQTMVTLRGGNALTLELEILDAKALQLGLLCG